MFSHSSPSLDNGAILFIKYAFAPNKLRYCGPSNNRAIFEYLKTGKKDDDLIKLLAKFEGAYPYLEYIAAVNKITDPFSYKVVEAYWIGNELLNNVSMTNYYEYLKNRFLGQWDKDAFNLLFSGSPFAAKPHHSFHVLSGFAKKKVSREILDFMTNCTISCGEIVKIDDNVLEIETERFLYDKSKIIYGKKEKINIFYLNNEKSSVTKWEIGDKVSFHWNWVCDKLTISQFNNLNYWNKYHINIFNKIV